MTLVLVDAISPSSARTSGQRSHLMHDRLGFHLGDGLADRGAVQPVHHHGTGTERPQLVRHVR
jgi:hypothetical protein